MYSSLCWLQASCYFAWSRTKQSPSQTTCTSFAQKQKNTEKGSWVNCHEKNVPMSSTLHCFVNKWDFAHKEVKYWKSYHWKFKRNLASGIALPRPRNLQSRNLLFIFYKRAMNAKLIHYPPQLTNPSSQKMLPAAYPTFTRL